MSAVHPHRRMEEVCQRLHKALKQLREEKKTLEAQLGQTKPFSVEALCWEVRALRKARQRDGQLVAQFRRELQLIALEKSLLESELHAAHRGFEELQGLLEGTTDPISGGGANAA